MVKSVCNPPRFCIREIMPQTMNKIYREGKLQHYNRIHFYIINDMFMCPVMTNSSQPVDCDPLGS